MEVKIVDQGEREVVIALSGVKVRFANALRRVMIAEVPKLAIDELDIRENTSLLYDEQLALRLALVPLKTDLNDYKEDNEITLSLKAASPEKAGYTMVYSKELISSDTKVEAASENIPVVKLISTEREIGGIKTIGQQKIALKAIARWGRGKEHAKWQPVTICGYKESSDKKENILLFSVESDGSLSVNEIILEAARIMQHKCEQMVVALKGLS